MVGPHDHVENVVEPKRRKDIQAIVMQEPNTDGVRGRGISSNVTSAETSGE
jgi:hypothetical protein